MTKERLSVRLNSHNYVIVKDVADTLFYNENKNVGNMSKAINWILSMFRLDTKYGGLLEYLEACAEYQRGNRSEKTIRAQKELLKFLKALNPDQLEVTQQL